MPGINKRLTGIQSSLRTRWRGLAIFGVILAFLVGLAIAIALDNWVAWTGFKGKTVWDWLGLLGVPGSLALLGIWFQHEQQKRAREDAQRDRENANALAIQLKDRDELFAQRQAEFAHKASEEQKERDEAFSKQQRELAAEEAREEALQAYFDRISTLLINEGLLGFADMVLAWKGNRPPGTPPGSLKREEVIFDAAIDIIRARTLSILRRFKDDPERKTSVIRFLIDTEVISKAKLSLQSADLSNADLFGVNLRGANLKEANLSGANLSDAILEGADLEGADLRGTRLIITHFKQANLMGANFEGAKLCHTKDLPSYVNLEPNRDCNALGLGPGRVIFNVDPEPPEENQ
jgi:hypothetical protein